MIKIRSKIMKKSVLILLIVIILIVLGLVFISDGNLSIGELLILLIVLIVGVFISDKIGE